MSKKIEAVAVTTIVGYDEDLGERTYIKPGTPLKLTEKEFDDLHRLGAVRAPDAATRPQVEGTVPVTGDIGDPEAEAKAAAAAKAAEEAEAAAAAKAAEEAEAAAAAKAAEEAEAKPAGKNKAGAR